MIAYEPGMVLCTKNGQRVSNAIVVNVGPEIITILSDFGNCIRITPTTADSMYEVSEAWVDHRALGGQWPSIKERIEQQIELLNAALQNL